MGTNATAPTPRERIEGGLVGLLIGDAVGVPYEFHPPGDLPSRDKIEMTPPAGFVRAHRTAPPGTWSDDGAQALCLLESLVECGRFDIHDFGSRLLRWLENGHLAIDAHVFDFGGTTHDALMRLRRGVPADSSGSTDDRSNGNGSLMRVLPLALWHRGADEELVHLAHRQSLPTHAHPRSQVACAFYCLVARALLNDEAHPVGWAEQRLRAIYSARKVPQADERPGESADAHAYELERIRTSGLRGQPMGNGYVVDTLWSALRCLDESSYENAVRSAIAFGHDTDTTACVAGGLAGIRFGIKAIPMRWREALRGRELYEPLLARLVAPREA
jgi:ADP-ribosyl-[dinitrogen reductase] hydrolase